MNNNESQPKELKKKSRIEIDRILIPVITAITGIFLPYAWKSIFDPLLTTANSAQFVISFLICLVVLSAVSVFLFKINEVHITQKTLLQETQGSQNRIFESERVLFREIRKSQSELIKKFGVNARLLTYSPTSEYKNSFQYPTPLIENASSIIALDYHHIEVVPVDGVNEPEVEYHQWYELLNRVIQNKPGIEYKRIIQLENGATEELDPNNHYDDTVIGHYRTILDVTQRNKNVKLITCPIFLSHICMIIVDHRYVIWELPTIEDDKVFHFDMDLVIEDPEGCFIKELELEIENRLENDSKVVKEIR